MSEWNHQKERMRNAIDCGDGGVACTRVVMEAVDIYLKPLLAAARAAERDACARVAIGKEAGDGWGIPVGKISKAWSDGYRVACCEIAAVIRARGDVPNCATKPPKLVDAPTVPQPEAPHDGR